MKKEKKRKFHVCSTIVREFRQLQKPKFSLLCKTTLQVILIAIVAAAVISVIDFSFGELVANLL